MKWQRWIKYLLPEEEQHDPAFRRELDQLAAVGLRVIAVVCVGAPLFGVISLLWLEGAREFFGFGAALGILIWGLLILFLSYSSRARPYARSIGIITGYVVFVLQVWGVRHLTDLQEMTPAIFSGILLVGIASLPLRPIHNLGLGLSMIASHWALAPIIGPSLEGPASMVTVMGLQMTLICTGLTAVVYHQRVSSYRARREAQESFAALRQAQSRLLMSENAASQGRFAAALSHELNSPIGALSSALDTLFLAYEKLGRQPDQTERFKEVIAGATTSARQSSNRLMVTVDRMKHLTNLDRAEEQMVDLNELWTSTVAFLQAELEGKAEVELNLKPLPPLMCRPQQISAVFSNLLRNSAQSMEGKGTIRIQTDKKGSEVVLEIKDDGRGIPSHRLAHLFDPSFRVEGSRVSTNWGLFISRSIVADHGGQIEISSTEGLGTTAKISLPIHNAEVELLG